MDEQGEFFDSRFLIVKLFAAISDGQAVANINLANLDQTLRAKFEASRLELEKKKEEVAVSSSPVSSSGEEKEDLKALSIEELQTLLNDVLEQEDYIRAIAIRDELSNRKK